MPGNPNLGQYMSNMGFQKVIFVHNPFMGLTCASHSFPSMIRTSFLRSNFNTRDFNTRDNFQFFGHSSEPRARIWSKIAGNASYKPPGAF